MQSTTTKSFFQILSDFFNLIFFRTKNKMNEQNDKIEMAKMENAEKEKKWQEANIKLTELRFQQNKMEQDILKTEENIKKESAKIQESVLDKYKNKLMIEEGLSEEDANKKIIDNINNISSKIQTLKSNLSAQKIAKEGIDKSIIFVEKELKDYSTQIGNDKILIDTLDAKRQVNEVSNMVMESVSNMKIDGSRTALGEAIESVKEQELRTNANRNQIKYLKEDDELGDIAKSNSYVDENTTKLLNKYSIKNSSSNYIDTEILTK